MMNYLGLIKQVVGVLVTTGVAVIVKNVVDYATPNNITTLKKVVIGIGCGVLAAMVCGVANTFVEGKIDELSEKYGVSDNTI